MKPALMLALAGFLFGLTGGAGYAFVEKTRPDPPAHALADSLAAVTARGDSLAVEHPDSGSAADPAQLAAAESPAPEPADTAAAPVDAEPESGDVPRVAAGPGMEPQRLAKLFGQMQPREAARVMSQMSDSEIQMILTLLGDRQASGILGSLPPERAAAVSRLVIGTNERAIQ